MITRPSEAAELVVLAGGCYSRGCSSQRGVSEVERLAGLADDPVLRARMLIRGVFAAVCTGEHDRTQDWAAEAARLAQGLDAFAFSDAVVLTAAPLILVDPGPRGRRSSTKRTMSPADRGRPCVKAAFSCG